MERRLVAMTAALAAALGGATSAQAARPDTPLRVGSLGELPAAVVGPGTTLTVTGELRNGGRRAVRGARVVLALGPADGRRLDGTRVGSATVGRLSPGQRRSFRARIVVPAGMPDGARLQACASSPGARGVCSPRAEACASPAPRRCRPLCPPHRRSRFPPPNQRRRRLRAHRLRRRRRPSAWTRRSRWTPSWDTPRRCRTSPTPTAAIGPRRHRATTRRSTTSSTS